MNGNSVSVIMNLMIIVVEFMILVCFIVIIYVNIIRNMKSIHQIMNQMINLFISISYHYNPLIYSLFGNVLLSSLSSNSKIIEMISYSIF